MHDTGPLCPPKEGGPLSQLIAAIQQAKCYNDEFLTKIIDKQATMISNDVSESKMTYEQRDKSPAHKRVKSDTK